jgi:hypothetical protein
MAIAEKATQRHQDSTFVMRMGIAPHLECNFDFIQNIYNADMRHTGLGTFKEYKLSKLF